MAAQAENDKRDALADFAGKHIFEQLRDHAEARRALDEIVKNGTKLTKVRSLGRKHSSKFKVNEDDLSLQFVGSGKKRGTCWGGAGARKNRHISLADMTEVRNRRVSGRRFTIVFGGSTKKLKLIAPDVKVKDDWIAGLRHLIDRRSAASAEERKQTWLMDRFREADRNGNGVLDKDEIAELLMNLNVSPKIVKVVREQTKVNQMDINEFVRLYNELSKRDEIDDLFLKYSGDGERMTVDELGAFFESEMNETPSQDDLRDIIRAAETSVSSVAENETLSVGGFNAMFATDRMNILRPDCRTVYQDMTRPLNDYFIMSSHNTYLVGNQLTSDSSVEQYARVLRHHCRSVEIDIWDGDDGEPVVCHGHTLTSKILFSDVAATINDHAFRTSPFPVILSIENHCSVEQQRRVAELMRSAFGSRLYLDPLPPDAASLPSPDQLLGKIIVKAKKLPADFSVGDDDSVSEDGESDSSSDEDSRGSQGTRSERRPSSQSDASRRKAKRKRKETKHKLAVELSECVAICPSVSFRSFEESAKLPFASVQSFSEKKALKFIDDGGQEFARHCSRKLTRVYPAGKRATSSNYNPMPMWLSGCQLVSHNFQTRDIPLLLNYGFFEDNGGCGYVLKPTVMLSQSANFNQNGPHPKEWLRNITIRVISAYNLPKKLDDKVSSILDPYVEVEVFGVPADGGTQRTQTITDNGFHPVWNEPLLFVVTCPELAVIMFRVMDRESTSSDQLVAQYCLPVRCMQTGYRMVALRDVRGHMIGPTSLFVHVVVRQPQHTSL